MSNTAPYGTWSSPITTDLLVEQTVRLSDAFAAGDSLYWTEGRPEEAGRQVVVERRADGSLHDLVPAGYSARTKVHEYGGLCTAVHAGALYFSNFADQRLYRVVDGAAPEAITPEPDVVAAHRYAGPVVTPDGAWVICVRERHFDEVENDLVAVSTSGDGTVRQLASGHDFFGTPALSPDGTRLAFCAWDHPRMPWDGTELSELELGADLEVASTRFVAGGPAESVSQPRYSPDGVLHFISDRTGWWNLYVDDGSPTGRALAPADAEFASADWLFGLASYAILDDGTVIGTWSADGRGVLGALSPGASDFAAFALDYSSFSSIRSTGRGIVGLAGSSRHPSAVVTVDARSGELRVVKASRASTIDASYLALPAGRDFKSAGGRITHALVYLPKNADFAAPAGERPPLIVAVHGGPTSSAQSTLSYDIQYWTSRGFAVADVNYGGSTGYGRQFREELRGKWGIVDVEDCQHVARALADEGLVDAERCVIHGGSAGGWTVLCATIAGGVFAAGASYYGVANLVGFAEETHKFESRYLDGLVGPAATSRELFVERSPICHIDELRVPLILFQGLEDEIVPPNQSEMIVEGLRSRGIPVAYIAYEGEQHGFRGAVAIRRTHEAELAFYGQVFGFTPAGEFEPVFIENADALKRTG
jgi:dipeptidyl aminopeptidase/acylaminoacyl peptidase